MKSSIKINFICFFFNVTTRKSKITYAVCIVFLFGQHCSVGYCDNAVGIYEPKLNLER